MSEQDPFERAVFLLRHARRNLKPDAVPAIAEQIDKFFSDNWLIPASVVSPMEAFADLTHTLVPLSPWPGFDADKDPTSSAGDG